METADQAIGFINKYGLAPLGWFVVVVLVYFVGKAIFILFQRWVTSDEKKTSLLERLTIVSEKQQVQLEYHEDRIEKLEQKHDDIWEQFAEIRNNLPVVRYGSRPKK